MTPMKRRRSRDDSADCRAEPQLPLMKRTRWAPAEGGASEGEEEGEGARGLEWAGGAAVSSESELSDSDEMEDDMWNISMGDDERKPELLGAEYLPPPLASPVRVSLDAALESSSPEQKAVEATSFLFVEAAAPRAPLEVQSSAAVEEGAGEVEQGKGEDTQPVPAAAPAVAPRKEPRVRGMWSDEEDEKLRSLAPAMDFHWASIADCLPGRNHKQVRERWVNYVDPNLNWAPWTEEDELRLLKLRAEKSQSWKVIARALGNRSENVVKNRYALLVRKDMKQKGLIRPVGRPRKVPKDEPSVSTAASPASALLQDGGSS